MKITKLSLFLLLILTSIATQSSMRRFVKPASSKLATSFAAQACATQKTPNQTLMNPVSTNDKNQENDKIQELLSDLKDLQNKQLAILEQMHKEQKKISDNINNIDCYISGLIICTISAYVTYEFLDYLFESIDSNKKCTTH